MRLLLYCVFENPVGSIPEVLSGVEGSPIQTLFSDGIGAAVSRVDVDLKPTVARALAYGEVIETFHQNLTVIPMRYGTFLQDEGAVLSFLARNEEAFKSLLQKLNDCVEMGVRILLPKDLDESSSAGKRRDQPDTVNDTPKVRPGRTYLESQRRKFSERELLGTAAKEAVDDCKVAFQGLYVDVKVEENAYSQFPTGIRTEGDAFFGDPTAVVHFLVRRDRLEAFYRSFKELSVLDTPKMLLSGPWPPYNFATLSFSS